MKTSKSLKVVCSLAKRCGAIRPIYSSLDRLCQHAKPHAYTKKCLEKCATAREQGLPEPVCKLVEE